jgi:hypothetical protein
VVKTARGNEKYLKLNSTAVPVLSALAAGGLLGPAVRSDLLFIFIYLFIYLLT